MYTLCLALSLRIPYRSDSAEESDQKHDTIRYGRD